MAAVPAAALARNLRRFMALPGVLWRTRRLSRMTDYGTTPSWIAIAHARGTRAGSLDPVPITNETIKA